MRDPSRRWRVRDDIVTAGPKRRAQRAAPLRPERLRERFLARRRLGMTARGGKEQKVNFYGGAKGCYYAWHGLVARPAWPARCFQLIVQFDTGRSACATRRSEMTWRYRLMGIVALLGYGRFCRDGHRRRGRLSANRTMGGGNIARWWRRAGWRWCGNWRGALRARAFLGI